MVVLAVCSCVHVLWFLPTRIVIISLWGKVIIIVIIIKTLFQEGNTISTKLISLSNIYIYTNE